MKRVLILLLTLTTIGLTACGTAKEENSSKENTVRIESSTSDEDSNEFIGTNVNLGETVTVDDLVQFTFNSVTWKDELVPSNENYYSYYSKEDGKVYFIVNGVMKNLSGQTINVNYNSMSGVLFNDKYRYGIAFYDEMDNGKTFGTGDITPLEEVNFHMAIQVPNDIKDSFNNAFIQWGFTNLLSEPSSDLDCDYVFNLTVDSSMISN